MFNQFLDFATSLRLSTRSSTDRARSFAVIEEKLTVAWRELESEQWKKLEQKLESCYFWKIWRTEQRATH